MNEASYFEPNDCEECGQLAEELYWHETEKIWMCPYCEHVQVAV